MNPLRGALTAFVGLLLAVVLTAWAVLAVGVLAVVGFAWFAGSSVAGMVRRPVPHSR